MGEATFRTDLRYAVRGLWQGVITRSQFTSQVSKILTKELSTAWNEGARQCGIAPDELSDEEIKERDTFIQEQLGYLDGFAEAIRAQNKKSGGDVFPLFERAKLWLNRYGEAKSKSSALACQDKKLEWKTNVNCKEHCSSCLKLNGKVKRGSYWNKTILPRSRELTCGGWRCCCSLVPTDKPVSKGRLSW